MDLGGDLRKLLTSNQTFDDDLLENFNILKSAVFKNKDAVAVLEVHVENKSAQSETSAACFAIVFHLDAKTTDEGSGKIKFFDDCLEVEETYVAAYEKIISRGYCKVDGHFKVSIGSSNFKQINEDWNYSAQDVDQGVKDLLDYIWQESQGELKSQLATHLQDITVQKVNEAESILLLIREAQLKNEGDGIIGKLSERFYNQIPHQQRPNISTLRQLVKKQELCQLIRDLITVNETTGWDADSISHAVLYRALKCQISALAKDDSEYRKISDLVIDSQHLDSEIVVDKIYTVKRPLEWNQFENSVGNRQYLFHASAVSNLVGILSRGLIMPKTFVEELGGKRTDAGMLGSGLYFSDSTSTSAKYAHLSALKRTRMVLVNSVALGQVFKANKHDLSLREATFGYDSVHGVRNKPYFTSDFEDDEFVIYNLNQQKICYLVEFHLKSDHPMAKLATRTLVNEAINHDEDSSYNVEMDDVCSGEDPNSNIVPGLLQKDNTKVPLEEVAVQCRIVDIVAQVELFQKYHNNSGKAIEAKYVFPLDGSAAVCGFEAFINGKHVIGKVKEKEKARTEYKEAISAGHGAYLMEEEKPEVFTISVGNLPPGAEVFIKIKYVCELKIDGNDVIFSIPNSVAPWDAFALANAETQDMVDTIHNERTNLKVRLEGSIKMSSNITDISATNFIKFKMNDNCAVFSSTDDGLLLDETGFDLIIKQVNMYTPRIWNELHPTENSQASMLCYYSDFKNIELKRLEVFIMIDVSNSMKLEAFENCLKISLMILNDLPSENCYFNVVSFGTVFRELFPKAIQVSVFSLKLAEEFIVALKPCFGNTDLVQALQSVYLLTSTKSSTKNIFLVSDGHINNPNLATKLIKKNSNKCRLFTFAVGQSADKHNMQLMAHHGHGSYQFFDVKFKSKWMKKVFKQMQNSKQVSINDLTFDWIDAGGALIKQTPYQIGSIFKGSPLLVYFNSELKSNLSKLCVKGSIDGSPIQSYFTVNDACKTTGTVIHTLVARSTLKNWENSLITEDAVEDCKIKAGLTESILELSKKCSILCSLTSFVAIETRNELEIVNENSLIMEDLLQNDIDILPKITFKGNAPLGMDNFSYGFTSYEPTSPSYKLDHIQFQTHSGKFLRSRMICGEDTESNSCEDVDSDLDDFNSESDSCEDDQYAIRTRSRSSSSSNRNYSPKSFQRMAQRSTVYDDSDLDDCIPAPQIESCILLGDSTDVSKIMTENIMDCYIRSGGVIDEETLEDRAELSIVHTLSSEVKSMPTLPRRSGIMIGYGSPGTHEFKSAKEASRLATSKPDIGSFDYQAGDFTSEYCSEIMEDPCPPQTVAFGGRGTTRNMFPAQSKSQEGVEKLSRDQGRGAVFKDAIQSVHSSPDTPNFGFGSFTPEESSNNLNPEEAPRLFAYRGGACSLGSVSNDNRFASSADDYSFTGVNHQTPYGYYPESMKESSQPQRTAYGGVFSAPKRFKTQESVKKSLQPQEMDVVHREGIESQHAPAGLHLSRIGAFTTEKSQGIGFGYSGAGSCISAPLRTKEVQENVEKLSQHQKMAVGDARHSKIGLGFSAFTPEEPQGVGFGSGRTGGLFSTPLRSKEAEENVEKLSLDECEEMTVGNACSSKIGLGFRPFIQEKPQGLGASAFISAPLRSKETQENVEKLSQHQDISVGDARHSKIGIGFRPYMQEKSQGIGFGSGGTGGLFSAPMGVAQKSVDNFPQHQEMVVNHKLARRAPDDMPPGKISPSFSTFTLKNPQVKSLESTSTNFRPSAPNLGKPTTKICLQTSEIPQDSSFGLRNYDKAMTAKACIVPPKTPSPKPILIGTCDDPSSFDRISVQKNLKIRKRKKKRFDVEDGKIAPMGPVQKKMDTQIDVFEYQLMSKRETMVPKNYYDIDPICTEIVKSVAKYSISDWRIKGLFDEYGLKSLINPLIYCQPAVCTNGNSSVNTALDKQNVDILDQLLKQSTLPAALYEDVINEMLKVLHHSGISSLGKNAEKEIKLMILVIMVVIKILMNSIPQLKKDVTERVNTANWSQDVAATLVANHDEGNYATILKALLIAERVKGNYPLAHYTLELGKNIESFCYSMLLCTNSL